MEAQVRFLCPPNFNPENHSYINSKEHWQFQKGQCELGDGFMITSRIVILASCKVLKLLSQVDEQMRGPQTQQSPLMSNLDSLSMLATPSWAQAMQMGSDNLAQQVVS